MVYTIFFLPVDTIVLNKWHFKGYGQTWSFPLEENPFVSVHLHTLPLKSVNLICFIDASFLWLLQSLTLAQSQHHVQPRRKEEGHKDVPVHQGRGHLPSRTHVALHQTWSAEIPHRRGSACLPGCCPWISYWWQYDISCFCLCKPKRQLSLVGMSPAILSEIVKDTCVCFICCCSWDLGVGR